MECDECDEGTFDHIAGGLSVDMTIDLDESDEIDDDDDDDVGHDDHDVMNMFNIIIKNNADLFANDVSTPDLFQAKHPGTEFPVAGPKKNQCLAEGFCMAVTWDSPNLVDGKLMIIDDWWPRLVLVICYLWQKSKLRCFLLDILLGWQVTNWLITNQPCLQVWVVHFHVFWKNGAGHWKVEIPCL